MELIYCSEYLTFSPASTAVIRKKTNMPADNVLLTYLDNFFHCSPVHNSNDMTKYPGHRYYKCLRSHMDYYHRERFELQIKEETIRESHKSMGFAAKGKCHRCSTAAYLATKTFMEWQNRQRSNFFRL